MGKRKPIMPITRVDKFFTLDDFELDTEMGREYLTDLNNTVLVFKIDYKKTKAHSLYGEARASQKVVSAPTEIKCRATIEEGEVQYLSAGSMRKEFGGKLTFTTYDAELEEKNLHINVGDFVGYADPKGKLRYYEVTTNNEINTANTNTILGFKSNWRKIEAIQVDSDVFNG